MSCQKEGILIWCFLCNGVDYNHFHNEIDPDFKFEKEFAEILEKGQPMIGYYGALAKWFDYQLVKELAETESIRSYCLELNMMILMKRRGLTDRRMSISWVQGIIMYCRIMLQRWMY